MKKARLGVLSLVVSGAVWSLAVVACGDDDAVTPSGTADASTDRGQQTTPDSAQGAPDAEVLPDEIKLETYSSDPNGLYVNSIIVYGTKNAMLIDGQYYKEDAEKLVAKIKATGKNLQWVLLTHAHPDHFLGFKVIKDAFPTAKFVTAAPVADAYKASAQGIFDTLKAKEGTKIADAIVPIESIPLESGKSIDVPMQAPVTLDGNVVRMFPLKFPGESNSAHVMVSLPNKRVAAGDLVFSKAHLYLAECKTGNDGWKGNLSMIAPFQFNEWYAGHGSMPAKFDVVGATAAYIDTATAIIREEAAFAPLPDAGPAPLPDGGIDAGLDAGAVERSIARIKNAYPDYQGDTLLRLSVEGYIANCE